MAKKTSKDHFQLLVVIFILLILGIIDHLTDLGSNNMIYLLPFGYFILFSMLSSHSLRKMVDELRARAEIILDERKFKKIFEDIPLLAVELDKTGHIKYANPFLLQITGYHEKEVLGSDWFELFVPRNSSFEVQSLFIEILSGEFHPFYQNPIMTKKHEERLISWYNVEIHDRYDKVSGSFSIGVDITDCDAENQQLKIALKEAREHISRLQAPLK
jgi:PAS domain S-box-containing protein